MRRICLLFSFLLCLLWTEIKAQQSSSLTHYNLFPTSFNPATAIEDDAGFVSMLYRNQWTGYSHSLTAGINEAPNTQVVNLVLPLNKFYFSNIGLNAYRFQYGANTDMRLEMFLVDNLKIGYGTLGWAVKAGALVKSLNFGALNFNDPEDPLNVGGSRAQTKSNFGLSVYYLSNNGFGLGLSVNDLLEPSFDYDIQNSSNTSERLYNLYLCKKFKIKSYWILNPSVKIQTDLNSISVDLGLLAEYKSNITTGIVYRTEEAIAAVIGYGGLLNKKIFVSYAFDLVVPYEQAKALSSSEIMIKYVLPEIVIGGRKAIKTPRFSF